MSVENMVILDNCIMRSFFLPCKNMTCIKYMQFNIIKSR